MVSTRLGFRNNRIKHTKHVAWPAILAKVLRVVKSLTQANEELGSALKTSHLVARRRLKSLSQLLDGQLSEALLIHLVLVCWAAREQAL